MEIIRWADLISGSSVTAGPVAATIGVFDGVHLGHRKLIESVVHHSGETESLVITFLQNPAKVLRPEAYLGNITSLPQKLERLESLGVRCVILVDFSPELSKLSGKEFIRDATIALRVKKIVVGYNFRFGHGRDSGTYNLKDIIGKSDIEIEIVSPAEYLNAAVSSSRIRKSIIAGRFTEVKHMLQSNYIVDVTEIRYTIACQKSVEMKKADIPYVLPKAGSYPVSIDANGGVFAGEVFAGEKVIRLYAESSYASSSMRLEYITF